MKPTTKHISIAYFVIVCIDLLLLVWQQESLRWFSKPLLMPVLLFLFYTSALFRKGQAFWLVVAALFFSWCGDVLLQAKGLFIPGLVSFLLAHVAYIFYFRLINVGQKGYLRKRPVIVLPVIVFVALLLYLLFPNLGDMKVPVVIYSFTIGIMLVMAFNTWSDEHRRSATLFIFGALLFVLSDSLLAIQLFAIKDPVFGPFVMATYLAAQFLIVQGALKREKSGVAARPLVVPV
jgi:uncharacterized membrane protein YhhN